MAGYTVRTLAQLAAEAKGAFVQAVQGTAAKLGPSVWRVEAKVLALLGFEMEQRRAWLVRQLFASTADRVWLIRHGFELGLQPVPATTAIGSGVGPCPPGLVVPAGLQYARGDGVTYTTLTAATAAGNSVTLALEADAAGSVGNAEAGAVLTLVNSDDAPAGAPATITVLAAADGSGLSGGADEEDTEAFRVRVLYRKRNPPQGGAAPDYVEWVQAAVAGATVYVDRFLPNAGSVWIQFTVLNLPASIDPSNPTAVLAAYVADPSIISPTAGQIAAAQAYVEDPIRRPVTAQPIVTPSTRVPVDIVIADLDPDTVNVRAAVELEIAATFLDRARPGTPSAPFTFSASWIDEAISRATGEDSHRLLMEDLVFAAGLIPVLGTIAYQ
ncbi:baseplate J/gp47 family protein [Methylobacterium sp. 391_Methyba4]|uniref:baseplate J/gp47 family protein n=1 Tax=Methylobacterium sp. 391_Methyba4 TaxID=3038924 RepID=UPI00241F6431|nr:baseplate J/gp47 family protein [Methylobacterium sp. 391_Methyba4]WFS07789.1 baseplate J/gp47 family protein [Methylobacterium sp. 391_Methyba4]